VRRDFELPGRSAVLALDGMAATPHPHATRIAVDVLRSGGNAVDAAVAAAAALAVVAPQDTGIGGDCFVILARGGQDDIIAYNGSGRAPMAATVEWYAARGISELEDTSPHTVTVPGAIPAWARIVADHGHKELAELLEPAAVLAERGHPIHARTALDWSLQTERLSRDPHAARVLLNNGAPFRVGELQRNPGLAEALRIIGRQGAKCFYTGDVARDMVDRLNELGGVHTLEDFERHEGEYVTPVRSSYRGTELLQIPPSNQGITALAMLALLECFEHAAKSPMDALRLHLQIEAARLAYRDRDALIADMRYADVPVTAILDKAYTRRLAALISPDRMLAGLPDPLQTNANTVYVSVVDRDRNAVSLINSVYHWFGSARVSPRFGIVLHNRGIGFRLDPAHPNAIAPGKRPLHTIMPGMSLRDGRVHASYGVVGGDYQPYGHTHFLTGVIDFGLDPQEAIDQPRVFYNRGVTEVERGVPWESIKELEACGHRIGRPLVPHGGGQCVVIDWKAGVLTGASDPRLDGCALGY